VSIRRFDSGLYLLGIWAATLVLLSGWAPTPLNVTTYDGRRLAEIALLIASAPVLIAHAQGVKLKTVLIAFGLATSALLLLHLDLMPHSGIDAALLFLCLFSACVLATRLDGEWLAQGVALSFVAAVLLAGTGFLAALVSAYVHTAIPFSADNLFPAFSNRRFLNHVLTWAMPLLACTAAANVVAQRLRATIFTATATGWLLTFASGSKGSLLAVSIATMLGLALFGRAYRRPALLQALAASVGLIVYAATVYPLESASRQVGIFGRDLTRLGDARWELWTAAVEIIQRHPLTGVGPSAFGRISGTGFGSPHNVPLQVAAEWGLPVLLVVATALLAWLYRLIPRIKGATDAHRPILIGAYTSLLAAIAHGMVSGIIVTPLSQIAGTLICAILLSITPDRQERPDSNLSRLTSIGAMALAMIAVIGLLWGGARFLEARTTEPELSTGCSYHGPRIWHTHVMCDPDIGPW
jgi:hypothetical protein